MFATLFRIATQRAAQKRFLLAIDLLFFTAIMFGVASAAGLAKGKLTGSRKTIRKAVRSQDAHFDADKRKVILSGVLTGEQLSANSIGDVVTFLFDGAKISLQTDSDPLIGTWVGTVVVPTRPGAKRLQSYLEHVRGAIQKGEDARVSLVLDLAGKRFTTEFPYGAKYKGDIMHEFVSPVKSSSIGSYTATLFIFVERRDPKSAVLVDIDSLDVEAKVSPSRRGKKPR